LYYIPARWIRVKGKKNKWGSPLWEKSNWSKKGKIYCSFGRASAAVKACLLHNEEDSDNLEIEKI
jgi:hypothetical protein